MMEIPKQLTHPDIRFVLLGGWDEIRNKKSLGKVPFEKAWQKNGYKFDDPKLLKHIQNKNFGVIGGYGNLRMLDVDDPSLVEHFKKEIGKTYSVKTGSGGMHLYFFSDYNKNHVLEGEKGELRADNYQVVSAPCRHPTGNYYEIVQDVPINTLSKERVEEIIKPYLRENIETNSANSPKGTDTSRSGLEFRKCIALLREGKSRDEVYKMLDSYSKWSSSTDQYKSLTFEKAEDFVLKENKETKENPFTTEGQVKIFLQHQPIFYDKSKMFWFWDKEKTCWKIVDDVDVFNLIDSAIKQDIMSKLKPQEVIFEIKKQGRLNIPEPMDKNFILFKNQLININNPKEVFEPNSSYFITNQIPYNLGESEETPTMDRIFGEWVGEEYVKTLYQIISYCLYADYPIHRIFYLFGEGLNGKSCFLNLVKKFVGKENCCSTDLEVLLNSRFEKCRLHKKLVCIMGETNLESVKNTSILKSLSGNDLIGFEYKNKDPFEDVNYSKLIISTNNLPPTLDKTIGFYRRMLIVKFSNQFSEKKDILNDIPEEEYENLSLKCLNLLRELLKVREFHNEGSIEDRQKRYEDLSNPFEKFYIDFVEEEPNSIITKNQFKIKLNEWLKENGFRFMGDGSIKKLMEERGIFEGMDRVSWEENGETTSKSARTWRGITWK